MEVGSASVVIRADLSPLNRGLGQGGKAVERFDALAAKSAETIDRRFNAATRRGGVEASRFSNSVSRLAASIGLIPGPAGVAAARFSSFLTVIQGINPVVAAFGLAIGSVTLGLAKAVTEAEKFERASLKTQAVLNATGYAAGLTAGEIRELALAIDDATLASVANVERAAQRLATFGNVSGEQFKETLKIAQDLAAATGTDVVSAVEKMGRAFENPVQTARQFRDIGLHEIVLLQAAAMQKAGKETESYGFIIDAIKKKVGGAGAGEAQGLAGAFDDLGDQTERFFAKIGNAGPLQLFTAFIERMSWGVRGLREQFEAFEKRPGLARMFPDARGLPSERAPTQYASGVTGLGASGIVQMEAAKRGAKIAEELRIKNDALVVSLKEQTKASEEAATAAQALNEQRVEAVKVAVSETAMLEKLIPLYLKSSMSAEETNKQLAIELQIAGQLRTLKLDSASAQGKVLDENVRWQNELTLSLDAELTKRQLVMDQHQQQLSVTRQAEEALARLSREVDAVGSSVGAVAASEFKEWLISIDELGDLSAEQIHNLSGAVGGLTTQLENAEAKRQASFFFSGELSRMLDGAIDGTKSLGQSFGDLARSIQKAAVEAAIFGQGPLAGLAGGGSNSSRGLVGLALKFLSGALDGDAGAAGGSGFASHGSAAFSGGFAGGGTLEPGHWGFAGERGIEPIFAGRSPLTVFPNRSGVNITINAPGATGETIVQMRAVATEIAAQVLTASLSGVTNLAVGAVRSKLRNRSLR